MIRRHLTAFIALGLLVTGTVATQASAIGGNIPTRYLITFHDGVDAQAKASAMAGLGLQVDRVFGTLLSGVSVRMSPEQAQALHGDPDIALLEQDTPIHANNEQSGATWALDRLNQRTNERDGTYTFPGRAGSGVVVYVVDTGLDAGTKLRNMPHVEFVGRVEAGANFVGDSMGADDCVGHGTMVAGSIAGTTHGAAKLATLIPARVLDCAGFGMAGDVVAALDWIAASRDRSRPAVVNLSLSGVGNQTLDNAVTRLHDSGVVVVAAAGNDGYDACGYSPARTPSAITVGATNRSDYRETYSNFGPCIDVFAPGSFIDSAINEPRDGFAKTAGTSQSAAFVSGIAALILSENPQLTSTQVRNIIVGTATPNVIEDVGTGSPNLLAYITNGG